MTASVLKQDPNTKRFKRTLVYLNTDTQYWAIQAGLLTPLTFARRRLSPLAAFTSGAYFRHNGRW